MAGQRPAYLDLFGEEGEDEDNQWIYSDDEDENLFKKEELFSEDEDLELISYEDLPEVDRHAGTSEKKGPKGPALYANNVLECWSLYFPQRILENIVTCTNKTIEKMRLNYKRERDAKSTDLIELKAFLGLLYLAGVFISKRENISDLWKNDATGVEIFRMAMGVNRFRFLFRALRFVDKDNNKKSFDKLSPVRLVLDDFVNNCIENYEPGPSICVGGTLIAFRGKCNILVSSGDTTKCRGIRLWTCVDADTLYTINLTVGFSGRGIPAVTQTIDHLRGRRTVICCHPCTISHNLSRHLLKTGFFLIGPTESTLAPEKSKKVDSDTCFWSLDGDSHVISYKNKDNKKVEILSTVTGYPSDTVAFYERTKNSCKLADEYHTSLSVARISDRWPLTVFFGLLNIGAVNSYIIYKESGSGSAGRKDYLCQLGKLLVREHAIRRSTEQVTPNHMRARIREVFDLPPQEVQPPDEIYPQAEVNLCSTCPRRKNRKTKTRCVQCRKPICREHTVSSCASCSLAKSVKHFLE